MSNAAPSFKLAQTERPGAAYLAIPQDIEALPMPVGAQPLAINIVRDSSPSATQIARAVAVLRAAKNPIILAGHGAVRNQAREALIRCSERLQIPVATTFMGKGVFPDQHPNALVTMGLVLPLLVVDNSSNLCKYSSGWFFRHGAGRTGHLILK